MEIRKGKIFLNQTEIKEQFNISREKLVQKLGLGLYNHIGQYEDFPHREKLYPIDLVESNFNVVSEYIVFNGSIIRKKDMDKVNTSFFTKEENKEYRKILCRPDIFLELRKETQLSILKHFPETQPLIEVANKIEEIEKTKYFLNIKVKEQQCLKQ